MDINQIIRCPNCGSQAERRYFTSNDAIYDSCPNHQVLQTECSVCDYLMVMCSRNASVIEAYAPSASFFSQRLTRNETQIYPQKSLTSCILDRAIQNCSEIDSIVK